MNKILVLAQNFKSISEIDIIIICVPTHTGIHREPDLSYIKSTLLTIAPFFKKINY